MIYEASRWLASIASLNFITLIAISSEISMVFRTDITIGTLCESRNWLLSTEGCVSAFWLNDYPPHRLPQTCNNRNALSSLECLTALALGKGTLPQSNGPSGTIVCGLASAIDSAFVTAVFLWSRPLPRSAHLGQKMSPFLWPFCWQ